MPRSVLDLQQFLFALWHEWAVLLTGGTIFAVVAIWGLLAGTPIPQNLGWPILILTFGTACFRAWRKEMVKAQPVSADPERSFVPASAKALTDFYRDHTEAVADKLTEPCKNKWMKVAGEIFEVANGTAHRSGYQVALIVDKDVFVFGDFRPEWNNQMLMLKKGQNLTIVGRVWLINANQVYLQDSEIVLLESGDPSPANGDLDCTTQGHS